MAHEVLLRGAELLKLSPIPGLEGVAKVLLGIWDALQKVETNRLACLRLTERCADILIAIQEEFTGLDKRVADALSEPIAKLENAFQEIERMMLIEIDQAPIKRYLRRDEVLEEIANCNTKLQDCLGHFDVRQLWNQVLEFGLASRGSPFAGNEMSRHSIEEIHESIRRIQERQNELDRSRDLIDQQNYTQGLESGQEVLEKLGIEKKDIPDAVKTLLRTLESLRSTNLFEKVSTSVSSLRRSSTWPVSHTDAIALRLQDRESIERDIRNLKAAYGEPVPTLPSWTITKFEIDLGEIIGRGFFSTVYKGKWSTRIVAVKVVEVCTSKESFVDEVNLWKKLNHPNILQIYGASSAEGTLPWFLVSPLMIHGNVADYLKRVHWNLQRHKESGSKAPDVGHQGVDFLQMMHDVAEGMRYLHSHGVYHGDLKAANVLVTEHSHCVVSDFGLSKWMNQTEQKHFLPNHALRWQAPELMTGDPVLREQVAIPDLVLSSPRVVISAPPELQDQDLSPYEQFESPVPEDLHLSPRVEYSTPFMATLDKLESGIEVLYDESEVESPLEGNLLIFDPSSEKPSNTFNKDDNATSKEPYEDQFELTYRMCLSHEFPRQLNFPLWTPGDVQLGDIGFLSRGGQFIRLFNSINPQRSSRGRMNIPGVESVSIAIRQQKDNFVRKSFKAISKLMSPGESGWRRIIVTFKTLDLAKNGFGSIGTL
ncbi:hypothetical protein C0993_003547 [Termitomyces sp. T159_Od127]|nr:hypothetical protein C0993_003547 [Termitomyces sp. T159_Od127]